MSNQTGDRYQCLDPNCGCELEVKRPCATAASVWRETSASERVGHGVTAGGSLSSRGFRSEGISTADDYGKQGATDEGVFGTVGEQEDHVHTEGRYDSKLPKAASHATSGSTKMEGPTCFCGGRMREVGAGRWQAVGA
ncbi:MAG: hypothetical protein WB985_05275 [Candidatus Acidiferrales bacterium]